MFHYCFCFNFEVIIDPYPAKSSSSSTVDQFWSSFVPVDEGGQIHPIPNMTIFTPYCHFDQLRASSFFKPIFLISISTWFFQVFLGHPLLLWPFTLKHNTFLKMSSFSLLKTCPYQCTPFAFICQRIYC